MCKAAAPLSASSAAARTPPGAALQGAVGATPAGMAIGMATKKVTVTLDELQLQRIRALVEAGSAPRVPGFVQHAVSVALDGRLGCASGRGAPADWWRAVGPGEDVGRCHLEH